MTISIAPLEDEALPLVWVWLHQYPSANFDDYGPKTYGEFVDQMRKRRTLETILCVSAAGEPVGVVAHTEVARGIRMFRGICFTKEVHGTGIPRDSVAQILHGMFTSGTWEVCAKYFYDGTHIRRFLQHFGAVDRWPLSSTLRDGESIEVRKVAISKDRFMALYPKLVAK